MLILHIIIAVTTIAAGIGSLTMPRSESARLMRLLNIGIFGTIASGVALVVLTPSTLLHVCISGSVFTVLAITMQVFGSKRLARAQSTIQ